MRTSSCLERTTEGRMETRLALKKSEMTAMMADNREKKRKGTLVHHASACP